MSRIEELLAKISACNRNRQVLTKAFDDEVQKYEKELAALEAQERRPRVFCIQLFEGGAITENTFRGTMPPLETITVHEVKPIVVTMEMAKSLYETGMNSPSEWDKPMTWVVIFRAAGIAAEPSND